MSGHVCQWPNCGRKVQAGYWGCREHWYTLPQHHQRRIRGTYIAGEQPSNAYANVLYEVLAWIRNEFGGVDDRHDPGRWERLVRWVRDRDATRAKAREVDSKLESDDIARRVEAQGDAPKD